MKYNWGFGLGLAVIFFTSSAFGAFTPAKLLDASKVALDSFSTASPSHVEHLTGFKSWKSGEDAKVKIYVDHEGMAMEFNFQCQDVGTRVDCQAAQD